jgi:hypothetical protein
MILTSRRQQRVLAEIRDALRGSDPRLVAKFSMFTRLTQDEEIPRFERVRASPLRWAVPGRLRPGAILFVPALVAALLGIMLVLATARPAASCATAAGHGHQPPRSVASQRSWMVPSCSPGSPGPRPVGPVRPAAPAGRG